MAGERLDGERMAIALDIDGVLIEDSFSPLIKSLVEDFGQPYTEGVECSVFSRDRSAAAGFLIEYMKLDWTKEELITEYFKRRSLWLGGRKPQLRRGAAALIERLRSRGHKLLCYGGLAESHFQECLAGLCHYFIGYLCTDSIRPGVREAIQALGATDPSTVLFVDDVALVGQAARALGARFVGMPAHNGFGFQASVMEREGMLTVLEPDAIDEGLLAKIELEPDYGR